MPERARVIHRMHSAVHRQAGGAVVDCDTVCDVSVVSIDFKVVNPDVGVVVGVNPYYNGSMERKCGVYWHSNNRGSDARKDRFMQSQGLTVVRIADTEFYGDFSEPMVKAIRQALAIAEQCVATANLASLQPLQLALPFDEERMVRGGGDLASA